MPTQDAMQLKEKILTTIRINGPSLPVHIARTTGLSILFSSAFLSELLSEKKIKISNMKVGSSPVYYLPNQDHMLERFSEHLKSKEKDAYLLLKENRFLRDTELEPAIRIALRMIKDFAIPFQKDSQIYWRYFTVPESEFSEVKETKKEIQPEKVIEEKEEIKEVEQITPKLEITKVEEEKAPKEETLDVLDKEEKPKKLKRETKAKSPRQTKKKSVANDKFFNKVKEFLSNKGVEISGVEGFSKSDITLRIKEGKKEKLLMAFNKKRISEADIVKAHKKSKELSLPYSVLTLGETPKKVDSFIEAAKNLSNIERLE
jgi:hypothetical protein